MSQKAIAVLAVVCILMLATPVVAPPSGLKQIRLSTERGAYIDGGSDPWLTDSTLVSDSLFTLDMINHDPSNSPKPDTDGVYLIIATNRDPRGLNGISVKIGQAWFSNYVGNTIEQHSIPDSEWSQVSGNNGVDVYNYNTAPHGVLTQGTWYTVQRIDPAGNNKFLLKGEANHLYVDFEISSPNPSDRIHIDSIGTYKPSDTEIGFTGNPYSSDLTWQIPEFPTLALPIASVLAIMFFMQKRKKEE